MLSGGFSSDEQPDTNRLVAKMIERIEKFVARRIITLKLPIFVHIDFVTKVLIFSQNLCLNSFWESFVGTKYE